MNALLHNAYRLAGLPATATPRELSSRFDELRTMAAIGVPAAYPLDRFWPGRPLLRDTQSIQQAIEALHTPRGRFEHALLWFWVRSDRDREALAALEQGDPDKALRAWTSHVWQKNGNDPLTCRHNAAVLSTALLLGAADAGRNEDLRARAAQEWSKLAESSVNRKLVLRLARIVDIPPETCEAVSCASIATREFADALAELSPAPARPRPDAGEVETPRQTSSPATEDGRRTAWDGTRQVCRAVFERILQAVGNLFLVCTVTYFGAIAIVAAVYSIAQIILWIGAGATFISGLAGSGSPQTRAVRPATVLQPTTAPTPLPRSYPAGAMNVTAEGLSAHDEDDGPHHHAVVEGTRHSLGADPDFGGDPLADIDDLAGDDASTGEDFLDGDDGYDGAEDDAAGSEDILDTDPDESHLIDGEDSYDADFFR